MAAEASRAPLVRERPSFAVRLKEFWDEIAPQIVYDNSDYSCMERWDGKGEGPGRHFAFEGFGISFSIFYGRMPAKREGL
jgi:hypothetical protein